MCSAEPSTKIAPSAKNKSQCVVCKYRVTNLSVSFSSPNTSDKLTTFDVVTLQFEDEDIDFAVVL